MRNFLNKYKNMSLQSKAALWFVICGILQKGISFFTVPLFSRMLTKAEYGTYSLYLSWLQILTIITSLYLYHGVFNNGMIKYSDDRDKYISSMQGLTLLVISLVSIVFFLTKNLWSGVIGLPSVIMIMMFIEMAFTPATHFWMGRQRFEFKYKHLVVLILAKSLLNPILGILLVRYFSGAKDFGRILSVVVVEALFGLSLMIIQFLKGKTLFKKEYWKFGLKMAIPLLPHYLSGIVLNQGDRVMIDQMVGRAEVAEYSIAYSIGMLVLLVSQSIINSYTPWIYKKMKDSSYEAIKKTVNTLCFILAVPIAGIMLCAPEVLMIVGGEKYLSAVYAVPPVAASVFFIFIYNMLAIPQFYYEKTKFLSISSLLAAGTNIILNYIFIGMFGYVAAGYTTLTCYIVYSLGHYIVSKKTLASAGIKKDIYDTKTILITAIFVSVIAIFSNFIFNNTFIRYGMIICICVIIYLNKVRILTAIKKD